MYLRRPQTGVAQLCWKTLEEELRNMPADERAELARVGRAAALRRKVSGAADKRANTKDMLSLERIKVARHVVETGVAAFAMIPYERKRSGITIDIAHATPHPSNNKLIFPLSERSNERKSRWLQGICYLGELSPMQSDSGATLQSLLQVRRCVFLHFTPYRREGNDIAMSTWCCPVIEQTSRTVSLLSIPENHMARDRLLEEHDKYHRAHLHSDQPKIPPPPNRHPATQPRCSDLKVCICKLPDRKAWPFALAFLSSLKRCAEFQYVINALTESLIFAEVVVLTSDDGEPDTYGTTCIVNLSFMLYSPCRPTLRNMLDSGRLSAAGNRILNVCDEYLIVYVAGGGCAADRWGVAFLSIHTSERPLPTIDPGWVEAEPLPASCLRTSRIELRKRMNIETGVDVRDVLDTYSAAGREADVNGPPEGIDGVDGMVDGEHVDEIDCTAEAAEDDWEASAVIAPVTVIMKALRARLHQIRRCLMWLTITRAVGWPRGRV